MIIKKEVKKEVLTFYFETFESKVIDDLISFINLFPKVDKPKYTNGTNILITHLKIEMVDNTPTSISAGISNFGGVDYIHFQPKTYYYFKDDQVKSTQNPDLIEI